MHFLTVLVGGMFFQCAQLPLRHQHVSKLKGESSVAGSTLGETLTPRGNTCRSVCAPAMVGLGRACGRIEQSLSHNIASLVVPATEPCAGPPAFVARTSKTCLTELSQRPSITPMQLTQTEIGSPPEGPTQRARSLEPCGPESAWSVTPLQQVSMSNHTSPSPQGQKGLYSGPPSPVWPYGRSFTR